MRTIGATIVFLLSLWSYSTGSSNGTIWFGLVFADTNIAILTEVQSAVNDSVTTINNDLLHQTRLTYSVIYNKVEDVTINGILILIFCFYRLVITHLLL